MVLRKHELEGKLGEERLLIRSGVLRDENPLDQSAEFNEFLVACRHGDLRKCQELIGLGVNINGKDKFDYTPLIIASLCGHYELVQLLLESGALAERNTFQGERCIYNALNDRIRNLLLQYDFSKSSDPYVYWSTHISGLLSRTTPSTSDICLVAESRSFNLHKFLLASRTPYFHRKLEAQPETRTWNLASAISDEALQLVLRYIYLADLPRELVPPGSAASEEHVARGLDKISRQLGVEHLWEAVMATGDRRLARQRYLDEEERALEQVGDFFEESVLGNKMVVESECVGDVRWEHDNAVFADILLRADENEDEAREDEANTVLNGQGIPTAGDKRPGMSALYPVHKAMLIRSGYFDKMFSGDFVESQASDHLHIVTVDCSPAVLEVVLRYLYTETARCPLELALDVLYAADMLFLDGLKAKAAIAISTLASAPCNDAEPINIYDVIHAAWDLGVRRLEEFSARYLAARLEDYVDDADFHDLIRQSAARLRRREETDTIELLDDIRYYLSERFRLRFEDAGLDDVMAAKDDADKAAVAVPTLDGDTAEDEFASDAINYHVLTGKIDAMLERLKLDA